MGQTANALRLLDQNGNALDVAGALPISGTITATPAAPAATYAAATVHVAISPLATDVFTITGSGTKTVKITKVEMSGAVATAGIITVQVVKRSTANSAGTSSAGVAVPYDSNSAAATATTLLYSVNPTLGTLVGAVVYKRLFVPATTSVADGNYQTLWSLERAVQPITLRGTGQVLAINFAGVTPTGGAYSFGFEWTEE